MRDRPNCAGRSRHRRTRCRDTCLTSQAPFRGQSHACTEPQMQPQPTWPWRADESPLNDLDDAESDTEFEGPDELPEEVLEQLEKVAPPPDPMPDPGPL